MNESNKSKTVLTTFRVLLSLIFLVSSYQHLHSPGQVALRLTNTSWVDFLTTIMPLNYHVIAAGFVLLVGGIGLLVGSMTRVSALVLMAMLIPITVTVQMDSAQTLGPLFKNIAIFGGLIYFGYFGLGPAYGIDNLKFKSLNIGRYFSFVHIAAAVISAALLIPSTSKSNLANSNLTESKHRDIAILVKQDRHLQVAIDTLILNKNGNQSPKLRHGTIVVCGKPGIAALTKNSNFKDDILRGQKEGLSILACGLSMKEANMTKEDLVSDIKIVENGLFEMIRLQAEGAISIEL